MCTGALNQCQDYITGLTVHTVFLNFQLWEHKLLWEPHCTLNLLTANHWSEDRVVNLTNYLLREEHFNWVTSNLGRACQALQVFTVTVADGSLYYLQLTSFKTKSLIKGSLICIRWLQTWCPVKRRRLKLTNLWQRHCQQFMIHENSMEIKKH